MTLATALGLLLAAAVPPQEPASAADPAPPPPAAAADADRIVRHDIAWRFDRAHPTGTFANGDPWVVGPVRIVGIEPRTTVIDGRTVHGSMIDPDPSTRDHGYDSTLYAQYAPQCYRPELNVALGVDAERPLTVRPGQSLISTESQLEPGPVSQIRTAAVLTVLAEPPPAGAFRPPYCKTNPAIKPVRFREAQLDYSVLGRLEPTINTPDPQEIAELFERVWLDHAPGWLGRYLHPVRNMKDYGRDLAADVGTAALLLQTDLPDASKRDLLVRLVQFGIDSHGNLLGGCNWPGEGGHGSGRKLPILLAGAVLRAPDLLAVGRDFPSVRTSRDEGTAYFSEDAQTFFVRETAPGVWNWGFGGYTQAHDGLPEFGFSHANDPKNDNAVWDADAYRRCCTANAWVGQCLAARIMGLQEAWHHPAFFAYMDRYMQIEPKGEWTRSWKRWHEIMWDRYRDRF